MSAKLINFNTSDFQTESDLEMSFYRWQERKEELLPILKEKGLMRVATTRVWNKSGIFRTGTLIEYADETAYKNCLPLWQELEKIAQEKRPRKIVSNRGIVIFDDVLR